MVLGMSTKNIEYSNHFFVENVAENQQKFPELLWRKLNRKIQGKFKTYFQGKRKKISGKNGCNFGTDFQDVFVPRTGK